jgi:tetratricopeptide (TPR) repeat protein
MGQYFADLHAGPESQLGSAPCSIPDSPEVAALRGAETVEELFALAKALNFQLRYREALTVYDRILALEPENALAYRQRAPRFLNTLQPEKAIQDFLKCRELGGDEADLSYRLGIARYLSGDYPAAMAEEEICCPLVDEEMAVAAMYWHTMSALRCGSDPKLLRHYRPGMAVGHHTAYERAMAFLAGSLPWAHMEALLQQEKSDLEYSMLAYGSAQWLRVLGKEEAADRLFRSILPLDSFWISYAYIAAWNDRGKNKTTG